LQQRQRDEHGHGLKWLVAYRLPPAIIGRAARREKERAFLDPMRDPRLIAFALLKFGFAGNAPSEERFADGRQRDHFHVARRSDDPGLDVAPGLATAGHQTFPAHIALEGFGRRCFRYRHWPGFYSIHAFA
jgi:hypothetical protein